MILVVEDETDVREELVEMLELRSFAVSGAACVALALESLKQGSSHVTLLTDLRLRDGSGLDLVLTMACQRYVGRARVPAILAPLGLAMPDQEDLGSRSVCSCHIASMFYSWLNG